MTPGPRNALTDIPGIAVGSAHDAALRSGVTVIRLDAPFRTAVDMRGGGPATRETDMLSLDGSLGLAHAITLSGGSIFGLDAAGAVACTLSGEGVGFVPVPGTRPVPLVPAACLYDLANGGDKGWGESPPYAGLACRALAAAGPDCHCGSHGAGFGAVAGAWRGGLGTASILCGDFTVAALVAVNSIGSPLTPDGAAFWAAPFEIDAEFGGLKADPDAPPAIGLPPDLKSAQPGEATCVGVIATDAPLSRIALRRAAIMAQDGLARAIRPSHAPYDGDTVFALSTSENEQDAPGLVMSIGAAAADSMARAVARGVWAAESAPGFAPAVRASLSARVGL